ASPPVETSANRSCSECWINCWWNLAFVKTVRRCRSGNREWCDFPRSPWCARWGTTSRPGGDGSHSWLGGTSIRTSRRVRDAIAIVPSLARSDHILELLSESWEYLCRIGPIRL